MSSQTTKALWKRWIEVWNGNLSIADEIIAPTFVAHFAPASTSPAEVRGPNGLKQWIGGSAAAFTDYSFSWENRRILAVCRHSAIAATSRDDPFLNRLSAFSQSTKERKR